MNALLRTITLLAALLLPSLAAGQTTTIELRESATATAGSPVRLDQVADLSGPDAARLATVVVVTGGNATSTTLTRDSIKAAINAGHPAVNWARTILRGGDISLTLTPAAATPTPIPAEHVETAEKVVPIRNPQPSIAPATQPGSSTTLRDLVLRALADAAGVGVADDAITLRLDTLPPADQQLLTGPVPASWKCRIQVLGATPAGRTSVRIEAYESDRVAVNRTLTIDALVTRDILVVATPGGLSRDQVIAANDLRLDRRTLPVNESGRTAAVTAESLIGSAVKRRLDQGKPILPGDVATVKSTVVAKRGDDITVSCISGGVILKTKAKAIGPARDGELVTLQIEGSKKTFTARMSGPGKAVMSLDPS